MTKQRIYLFVLLASIIALNSCQYVEPEEPPARLNQYGSRKLADKWRQTYPQDNDAQYYYPQTGYAPPPVYYAPPPAYPSYGQPAVPYYPPYTGRPYGNNPYVPTQPQQRQDNDSDYYYPLFFDGGG